MKKLDQLICLTVILGLSGFLMQGFQRIIESPGGSGGTGPGGGITNAFNPVVNTTFSATPTFAVPDNTKQGITFKITLTANVTSSTLTGITNSQWVGFIICQDSTGGRSFVWPTTIVGGPTVSATVNSQPSTCYAFGPFYYDGTNSYGPWEVTAGATGALIRAGTNTIDIDTAIVPRLSAANTWTALQTYDGATGMNVKRVTAPANPAAGYLRVYADNATGTLKCLDSAGASCMSTGGSTFTTSTSVPCFIHTQDDPQHANNGAQSFAAAANTIYFKRFVLANPCLVSKMIFYQSNTVASSFIGIGIYDSSLNRVVQTGAVDTSVSGGDHRSVNTTSSVTLQPGTYVWAWASNNNGVGSGGVGAAGTVGSQINYGTVPQVGTATGTFSTSTGMPATISGLTSANPAIILITATNN